MSPMRRRLTTINSMGVFADGARQERWPGVNLGSRTGGNCARAKLASGKGPRSLCPVPVDANFFRRTVFHGLRRSRTLTRLNAPAGRSVADGVAKDDSRAAAVFESPVEVEPFHGFSGSVRMVSFP